MGRLTDRGGRCSIDTLQGAAVMARGEGRGGFWGGAGLERTSQIR